MLDQWFKPFNPPTSRLTHGLNSSIPPPPPVRLTAGSRQTSEEPISLTKDLNPSTPPLPPPTNQTAGSKHIWRTNLPDQGFEPLNPPPNHHHHHQTNSRQQTNIWRTNLPDQGSEPLNPPPPVRLTAGSRQTHTSHTAQDLTARLTAHKR